MSEEQIVQGEISQPEVGGPSAEVKMDRFSDVRSALEGMDEASPYSTSDAHQEPILPPVEESMVSNDPVVPEQSNNIPVVEKPSNEEEKTAQPEVKPEGDTPKASLTSDMTGDVLFDQEVIEPETPQVAFNSFSELDEALISIDGELNSSNIVEKLPVLIEAKNNYDQVAQDRDKYVGYIESMPAPLFEAFKAHLQGDDWTSPIDNRPKFDFQKDFKDQDSIKITDHFFSGKITKEEWADYNGESPDESIVEKINHYKDLAKGSFDLAKTNYEQESRRTNEKIESTKEVINASYSVSKGSLDTLFEGTKLPLNDSFAERVDKVAQSSESVMGLFYNNDGTLKEDAHQRIAMALGGRDLVKNQAKALEKKMITKARQEAVGVTSDNENLGTSSGATQTQGQVAQQKAQQVVDEILYKTDSSVYG